MTPVGTRPSTIVAFGTYQKDSHPRVRTLIEGLRELGHEVIEVNEPLGLRTSERVAILREPWRVPVLGGKLASRWARLHSRGRALRRRLASVGREIDAVLVGYLGHFDVHLARRTFPGVPIVLDHLIFAEATARDRGQNSTPIARALRELDRRALGAADIVVVDTEEHREMVPVALRDRAVVCPVGADKSWFAAAARSESVSGSAELAIVFFGLFTPLQGTEVIGRALGLVADAPIRVTMIGTGQDYAAARAAANSDRVTWIDWVEPAELPDIVARHDVALGIFGGTPKARNVVPTKIYQSAAAGCALISSDTPPQARVLAGRAELVPPETPLALAEGIRRLAGDRDLVAERRRQAAELAAAAFTAPAVARPLDERIRQLRAR